MAVQTRLIKIIGLLLMLILAACDQGVPSGGTYVWLDVPTNGLVFEKVQPIKIEGHAASPGGVQRVEIWINGALSTTLNNPPIDGELASFHTEWTAPLPGEYTIQAMAFGSDGTSSQLDSAKVRFGGSVAMAPAIIILTGSPTVTQTSTPTITATPEPNPPTPTPTTTATNPPGGVIKFWADPAEIDAGGCTNLRWHVENAQRVIFGGIDQPLDGSDKECICSNKTYPLTVVQLDGTQQKKNVEVSVHGSCVTPEPEDNTPPPAPHPSVPANGLKIACKGHQTLAWMPVSDESGIAEYRVEVMRSSNNKKWVEAPGSPMTGIDGKTASISVECGWYYRWRVRAVDKKGNVGAWSGWSSFSITLG